MGTTDAIRNASTVISEKGERQQESVFISTTANDKETAVPLSRGSQGTNGFDEFECEVGWDPENGVDEDTEDWSPVRGAENAVACGPGKPRQGNHSKRNPFVEFEDREMRLNWERQWLKDDEVYMRERMKGMRVDSVQARLQKESMSGDMLYDDAVYFGAHSCRLSSHKQKKADLQRRAAGIDIALPPVKARAAGAAIESMEAEHHAKTKKGQKGHADKAKPTQDVMWLKSMQAVLEESGRRLR